MLMLPQLISALLLFQIPGNMPTAIVSGGVASKCGANSPPPVYASNGCSSVLSGGQNSINCTVSGVLRGETLVIGYGAASNASTTSVVDSNGDTVHFFVNTSTGSASVYYVENASAGSHQITVSFSGSRTSPILIVNVYDGASCTAPLDTNSGEYLSGGQVPAGTYSTASFSTNNANEVLWSYFLAWWFGANPLLSSPAGFTTRTGPLFSDSGALSNEATAATAGSYTTSITTGAAVAISGLGVAIKSQ